MPQTSDRLLRVFGPPGTGKTTYLLNQVDQYLKAGVSPERIGYMAFTRKAANEAVERARANFNLKEDDLPWFRTLHSTAFKMLGLSVSEVMQAEHYQELSEALGGQYRFKIKYDATMEHPPMFQGTMALGDEAMALSALMRALKIGPGEVLKRHDLVAGVQIQEHELAHFERTLDEYKRSESLLDFADFLDEVRDPLPLEVLIIDEAQDLTPQQWDFARRIGAKAKRIIIAGDDDQAIYEWAGADIGQFLHFNGQDLVLPKSYRLNQKTWQLGDSIARRIRHRKEKTWAPRDEIGEHEFYSDMEQIRFRDFDGDWLLLSRMKAHQQALVKQCREQGVVYRHNGIWSNQTKAVRAVLLYESLRAGNSITVQQAHQVARYIPALELSLAGRPRDEVMWDDIPWLFEGKPDWLHAMKLLPDREIAYIRRLKHEGESLIKPGKIEISTIHASKGGEADNVLVMPDMNKRVHDQARYYPDQEHRVWYVAVTRARHRLHIPWPQSWCAYDWLF